MEEYQRLEVELARWIGTEPENVVCCSSGTAALHLSLEALQLPLGSEVLVPNFTMIACPRAVTLAGLAPVFVDCGEDLLMDPLLANDAIGQCPGVRAAMLVHIYGRQCATWWIDGHEYANPSCAVIEDLAEAHGVKPHPDTDAACWSFFRNKHVAGEEGGAIAFRDPSHAVLARQLRCLGFTDAHDFQHVPRGHNYRMTNAHAELILVSLDWFEDNMTRRRQIEAWYETGKGIPTGRTC